MQIGKPIRKQDQTDWVRQYYDHFDCHTNYQISKKSAHL